MCACTFDLPMKPVMALHPLLCWCALWGALEGHVVRGASLLIHTGIAVRGRHNHGQKWLCKSSCNLRTNRTINLLKVIKTLKTYINTLHYLL